MNPLVSVYCLAYNHEKYIRNALEGFISQRTNFRYEVIVHDDASTDNTAGIIKEFADKYPDIIIPIYQTENQYSQKIPIVTTYIYPMIKGKYIAICEGDDYWCDCNKLQSQVDWLENHPEYSFCVHNTISFDVQTGRKKLFNKCRYDKDIPLDDILQGGGAFFHTSSFLLRTEYWKIPDEFKVPGIGDYPRAIYLALCGKVRYLHNIMSIYRMNVEGSFTKRINAAPINKREEVAKQIIQMLHNVDLYTQGTYKKQINHAIQKLIFGFLYEKGDLKAIKKECFDYYTQVDIATKTKLYIRCYLPKFANSIKKFRKHK